MIMDEKSWIPEPSELARPFFDGAREHKLRLQVCVACGTWHYPLATVCSECGAQSFEWRDASGKGTLYAHARLMRAYHPRHENRLPLILAEVDIDEGLRLMTNLVGADLERAQVGVRVEVAFETFDDGGVLPVFKPESG